MQTHMTCPNSVNKSGRYGFPRKMRDSGVLTVVLYKSIKKAGTWLLELGWGVGNGGMEGSVGVSVGQW